MLNPDMVVLHTNFEPSIPVSKGKTPKRPANWQKTIAEYYMVVYTQKCLLEELSSSLSFRVN